MLVLDRKEKEAILLKTSDGTVTIRILRVENTGHVKVGIDAPLSVNIVREEIKDRPYTERRVA